MLHELVRVTLNNEMDLVLVHRRSMKLAEMAGLSLSAQTTFATAVSEVSRNTIEHGKNGCLVLCVSHVKNEKQLIARIIDETYDPALNPGLEYAKRLVNKLNVSTAGDKTAIELYFSFPLADKLDAKKIDEWRRSFNSDEAISPYEEIKRKNEQLQSLAEKLKESEGQYKTLTNSLPIIIFSLGNSGELIYANKWLSMFTGKSIEELNISKWKDVVHADDYDAFHLLMNPHVTSGAAAIKVQCRLKNVIEDQYYWHLASLSPLKDEKGDLLYWIGFVVDIHAQKVVENTLQINKELQLVRDQLKEHQLILEDNIAQLNRSNKELQQFAYIASHDLQEPIRKISYYSDYFLNKYRESIDEKGKDYLHGMLSASRRMRTLINDLLAFSQVDKKATTFKQVDLENVFRETLQDMELNVREKSARIQLEPLPTIEADESMIRQLFGNILSNSLKYAREHEAPLIRISCIADKHTIEIAVADNGIGFDEKYLPKMFTLFQRLHTNDQYKGTGLGLAICQKIVDIHNGSITATSKENEGATFKITLPVKQLSI
ncbi:ATP-binding protein [Chitinophaga horti]|uniref:histidine kinase n=1 Tax=Chitinophaga horti TaxID=2920382 RepID=A0ABY6IZ30_9BACT|nr:ATP-binding protein [Chitinophaga horti]UYQ92646.1 ATP-binding protein [Chitinophaga horti]